MFSSPELVEAIAADTDGQLSLILRRIDTSGSANLTFASREHGSLAGPTLSISVTAVPEPATATLALLGLSGLAMRRRRKTA